MVLPVYDSSCDLHFVYINKQCIGQHALWRGRARDQVRKSASSINAHGWLLRGTIGHRSDARRTEVGQKLGIIPGQKRLYKNFIFYIKSSIRDVGCECPAFPEGYPHASGTDVSRAPAPPHAACQRVSLPQPGGRNQCFWDRERG